MSSSEQIGPVDADRNQKVSRRMRGLRAVVTTLLVVGLVAAIASEIWFGRPMPIGGEDATPTEPPTMEWGISPGPAGPDEFRDRMPTPSSTIVG